MVALATRLQNTQAAVAALMARTNYPSAYPPTPVHTPAPQLAPQDPTPPPDAHSPCAVLPAGDDLTAKIVELEAALADGRART